MRHAAAGPERQILYVRLACLAGAVILAVGLWANLPYLIVEHRRLELWKICGLWCGDFMALLWFLRFVFDHAVLGEPLVPRSPGEGRKSLRVLACAGLAALLLDLAMTCFLMLDERQGYLDGCAATARVTAIQEHRRELATGYDLECEFPDTAGVRHTAHLRVYADRHVIPAPVAALLQAPPDSRPPVHIRYDPRLPARAWVDGLGWNDENGLYWLSISISALQAGVTLVWFLLLCQAARVGRGEWPWWWDIYKALPLAAETFCMLVMGLIDRIMDSL